MKFARGSVLSYHTCCDHTPSPNIWAVLIEYYLVAHKRLLYSGTELQYQVSTSGDDVSHFSPAVRTNIFGRSNQNSTQRYCLVPDGVNSQLLNTAFHPYSKQYVCPNLAAGCQNGLALKGSSIAAPTCAAGTVWPFIFYLWPRRFPGAKRAWF